MARFQSHKPHCEQKDYDLLLQEGRWQRSTEFVTKLSKKLRLIDIDSRKNMDQVSVTSSIDFPWASEKQFEIAEVYILDTVQILDSECAIRNRGDPGSGMKSGSSTERVRNRNSAVPNLATKY